MKKIIVSMLAVIMLLCAAIPAFAQEPSYEIIVNGNAIRAEAVMYNGTLMVPMKAVSRALGYKISYQADQRTYHLEDGRRACDIAMDCSVYTAYSLDCLGMTAPTDLGSEPVLLSGTIYVPAELYRMLLGNSESAVKTKDGCLYINSSTEDHQPDNRVFEQYTLTVNGKKQRAKGRMIDGTVMVPLKQVARALGYKISYSRADKTYHMENSLNACDISFGNSIYTIYSTCAIGMTAPEDLGSEPVWFHKTTYVPVELFKVLLGNHDEAVVIHENTIAIQSIHMGAENPNA